MERGVADELLVDAMEGADYDKLKSVVTDDVELEDDEHDVPFIRDIQNPEDLPLLEHLNVDPPSWSSFASDALGILLAVLSMMSAANEFSGDVRSDVIRDFGEERFERVVLALTFFPLVYVFLVVLRLNNHYALRTYFEYLQRGYIVDFPPSASARWVVSRPMPLLFIIVTTVYTIFTAVVFTMFFASANIWILFYKQLLFDVILLWKELQTVEGGVITLNEFIEAFADEDEEACIDHTTTNRAAHAVTKLRPVQTRESYKAYTEKYGVQRTDQWKRMLRRWVTVLLLCGLCVGLYFYFSFESDTQSKAVFDEKVNPCARVCFDRMARQPDMCFGCVCDCITAYGESFDVQACLEKVAIPGCEAESACYSINGTLCV